MEFWLAVAIMVIGLAGTLLPGIPGVPLVFLGALFYAFMTDFLIIDGYILTIMLALAAAAVAAEPVLVAASARKWGGSNRAMWGALLGGVVGLLLGGPLGLIAGIPGGAFAAELAAGRTPEAAARSAMGAVVGLVAGRFFSILMGGAIFGLFLWHTL